MGLAAINPLRESAIIFIGVAIALPGVRVVAIVRLRPKCAVLCGDRSKPQDINTPQQVATSGYSYLNNLCTSSNAAIKLPNCILEPIGLELTYKGYSREGNSTFSIKVSASRAL